VFSSKDQLIDNMTFICFCKMEFYYIAPLKLVLFVRVNNYLSEKYLFVVANNVGFLKRFGGL
jgi:hypothetical protein